jgi:hypothetical protein
MSWQMTNSRHMETWQCLNAVDMKGQCSIGVPCVVSWHASDTNRVMMNGMRLHAWSKACGALMQSLCGSMTQLLCRVERKILEVMMP